MNAFEGVNYATAEGAKIKSMLEARLTELRVRNDDPQLTERETQATRGAIAEIKRLLADPKPLVPLASYNTPRRA